ncbi:MAG: hypothetical protein IT210_02120 [Armatimonadetes bacterium]|nr:hypothetical protein [Armatimonadota bacterium]
MAQILCTRCQSPVQNIPQWLAGARIAFLCQRCRDASQAESWEQYKQKSAGLPPRPVEKSFWDEISYNVLDELLKR